MIITHITHRTHSTLFKLTLLQIASVFLIFNRKKFTMTMVIIWWQTVHEETILQCTIQCQRSDWMYWVQIYYNMICLPTWNCSLIFIMNVSNVSNYQTLYWNMKIHEIIIAVMKWIILNTGWLMFYALYSIDVLCII